jgi:hypothetical protein
MEVLEARTMMAALVSPVADLAVVNGPVAPQTAAVVVASPQSLTPNLTAACDLCNISVPALLAGTNLQSGTALAAPSSPVTANSLSSSVAAPAGLTMTAKAIDASHVNLTWTASSGASSYLIDCQVGNGARQQIANLGSNNTSCTVNGLGAGTTYGFDVGACNSGGVTWAPAQNATTFPGAFSMTAKGISASQVNLYWTASSGANSYLIYYKVVNGAFQQIGDIGSNNTSCTVNGLSSGTNYGFDVVASNSGGVTWAPAQSATTLGLPAASDSNLLPNGSLQPGEAIFSPDGRFSLAMQGDGNLVLSAPWGAIWSTNTSGQTGSYATMQSDGNFVVYNGSRSVWDSGTWGKPGAYLQLQNDGNMVIYQNGAALWSTNTWWAGTVPAASDSNLIPNQTLQPNVCIFSPNNRFKLKMQTDGNLVLYAPWGAIWSTNTCGQTGSHAIMQTDGNFVVYNGGRSVWDSGTWGRVGAYLQLQNDGNMVIYQNGVDIWHTGTWWAGTVPDASNSNLLPNGTLQPNHGIRSPDGRFTLDMQTDGNLVLYKGDQALWSSNTCGQTGAYATMQADGNFVVYNGSRSVWDSGTWGRVGAYLQLQNDGNLVIYQNGVDIWHTGTWWANGVVSAPYAAAGAALADAALAATSEPSSNSGTDRQAVDYLMALTLNKDDC